MPPRLRLGVAVAVALLVGACGAPTTTAEGGATPTGTGTAAPTPTGTAAPTPTEATAVEPPPVPAAPPAVAVVATSDFRVAVVDPDGDEELTTLEAYDDPQQFGDGGEPIAAGRFFDSLAVAPDRQTAYVAVCCEPAPGALHRLAVEGGADAELLAYGYEPALRADGARIAVSEMQWITILDRQGAVVHSFAPEHDAPLAIGAPAWSPDGRLIVFEHYADALDRPRVMVLDVERAESMADARPLRPSGTGGGSPWSRPTFDRHGRVVVAEQPLDRDGAPSGAAVRIHVDPVDGTVLERTRLAQGVRTQVHDASGGWLLAVLADGSARWRGPEGQEGSFGRGLLAAAW